MTRSVLLYDILNSATSFYTKYVDGRACFFGRSMPASVFNTRVRCVCVFFPSRKNLCSLVATLSCCMSRQIIYKRAVLSHMVSSCIRNVGWAIVFFFFYFYLEFLFFIFYFYFGEVNHELLFYIS